MVDVATKDDIKGLRDEMRDEMGGLRAELRDEIRAVGIKVERLDTKVDGVIEGLTSTREELKRDMAAMEERLTDRMGTIERVVRENSADIARQSDELRRLTGTTGSIHQDILALRVDVTNGTIERVEIQRRMTEIEKRLGIKKS